MTDYQDPTSNNNKNVAVGPFVDARISEYSTVRLLFGYVTYFIEAAQTSGTTNSQTASQTSSQTGSQTENGLFVDLSINQRLGPGLSHSLSVGRQFQSTVTSGTADTMYVTHAATWQLFLKTSLSTSISYQHITESGGLREKLDQYSVGLSASRQIMKHLSTTVQYQLYLKNSDLQGSSYTQNRLVFDLNYTF